MARRLKKADCPAKPVKTGMLVDSPCQPLIEAAVAVRPGCYEVWGRNTESFFDMLKDMDRNNSGYSGGYLRLLAKRLRERIGEGYWNGRTCRWEFPATPKAREVLIEFSLLSADAPVPEPPLAPEELPEAGRPPVRRQTGIRPASEKIRVLDGKCHIAFNKDEEFQKKVQAIPGVVWDRKKREWIAPETGAAARPLAGMGLAEAGPQPDLSWLSGLFPYQIEGVEKLCEKGFARYWRICREPERQPSRWARRWRWELYPAPFSAPRARRPGGWRT